MGELNMRLYSFVAYLSMNLHSPVLSQGVIKSRAFFRYFLTGIGVRLDLANSYPYPGFASKLNRSLAEAGRYIWLELELRLRPKPA